jgi:hypothetical protein
MSMTQSAAVNQLRERDDELEQILTSFDSAYSWNYGHVKDGLHDLYEKAKREQWNGTEKLAWSTPVGPEVGILPDFVNPLIRYAPFEKLNENEGLRGFVWVRFGGI